MSDEVKKGSKGLIIGIVIGLVIIIILVVVNAKQSSKIDELTKFKEEADAKISAADAKYNELQKSYAELEGIKNQLEERVKILEIMSGNISASDSIVVELKSTISSNPKLKNDKVLKLISALESNVSSMKDLIKK
ncbi:MAG TPA: hypothetical protein PLD27_08375 [bacterium]|nr:hypothetical protein [bacterium]HOL48039.1 hypothetical protein [bacterium]HPQ19769.1 hypothetical protein [bacterium]